MMKFEPVSPLSNEMFNSFIYLSKSCIVLPSRLEYITCLPKIIIWLRSVHCDLSSNGDITFLQPGNTMHPEVFPELTVQKQMLEGFFVLSTKRT